MRNKRKLRTLNDILEIVKNRNGYCFSEKYDSKRMEFWCGNPNHKHWFTKSSAIFIGQWCPYCARKTHNIREAKEFAKKRGGECLSEEYINNHTHLQWKCGECDCVWKQTYKEVVTSGTWCPKCATNRLKTHTIEDARKIIESHGGICIDNEYVNAATPINYICKNGHYSHGTYGALARGVFCAKCYYERKKCKYKSNIEEMKEFAKNIGWKCLSETYHGVENKLEFKCDKGHIIEMTPRSLFVGNGCRKCNNINKGKSLSAIKKKYKFFYIEEEKSRFVFQELTGYKFPSDCITIDNGQELDGYCKELNLAFEYDGEQHYRDCSSLWKKHDIEKQKESDVTKNQRCAELGIKMIRIPYYIKDLYTFIKTEIEKLNIEIKTNSFNWDKFSIENLTENRLNEMREKVRPFGFSLISNSYLGINEKYTWKCDRGHEFLCSWHEMRRSKKPYCEKCEREDRFNKLKNNAEKHGLKLLSTEYKDSYSKYLVECKKGHIIETYLGAVSKDVFNCHECKNELKIRKIHEFAKKCNGECLSSEYTAMASKYEWRCSEGHIFISSIDSMQHKVGFCEICKDRYENYGLKTNKENTLKISIFEL